MLLWQLPVGNQYFQSENNTNGHVQDNRVEYIFGHVPELIGTGVVGALLGRGNGDNSTWGGGLVMPSCLTSRACPTACAAATSATRVRVRSPRTTADTCE